MAKNKNPKISQKVIERPDVVGTEFGIDYEKEEKQAKESADSVKERKIQAIAKRSRELNTVAEIIAQDKHYQRNHIWPGAKEAFPFNVKLQTVDKFFPFAADGPLFVDEPTRKDDIAPFKIKQEAMKKLGHRYLLLEPGMTEVEALEVLA